MKLKRYCVTVMDNWTPMRDFWTLEGAKRFYRLHRYSANVFKWDGEAWAWMCGAHDRGIMLSPFEAEHNCIPQESEVQSDAK